MRGTESPSRASNTSRGSSVGLLVVELGQVLGHDGAEQHRAVRRTARRQVRLAERDATRRHVPAGVAHEQFGEEHRTTTTLSPPRMRPGCASYSRSTTAAANSEVFTSVAPSISRAKS